MDLQEKREKKKKEKRDSNWQISKYKARLVAQGFSQQEGVDYQDCQDCFPQRWYRYLYMEQPEGFAEDQTKVCKLCKVMKKKGCEASEADPCIYTKKERDSFVTFSVYVDDVILASNDTDLFKREKIYLAENFNNVDQCEIYYIHGMTIERYRKFSLAFFIS